MPKTSLDVITRAHRAAGVLATNESAENEMRAYGLESLTAIFDELQSGHGTAFAWTLETVPDGVFGALADALAATIAPHYGVAPTVSYARAIGRVRAFAFPNDVVDRRDVDESGTISEAEEAAGKRAAFY